MVLASALVGRRDGVAVEHELYVVVAVGDAHVDPAELLAVGGAAPKLVEAKEVAVKLNGLLAAAYEKAEVIDGVGDAGCGKEFACVSGFPSVGLRFDELDEIAVGIFDLEVEISGSAFTYFWADCDAARGEIGAHLFGVRDDEGDVAEVTVD